MVPGPHVCSSCHGGTWGLVKAHPEKQALLGKGVSLTRWERPFPPPFSGVQVCSPARTHTHIHSCWHKCLHWHARLPAHAWLRALANTCVQVPVLCAHQSKQTRTPLCSHLCTQTSPPTQPHAQGLMLTLTWGPCLLRGSSKVLGFMEGGGILGGDLGERRVGADGKGQERSSRHRGSTERPSAPLTKPVPSLFTLQPLQTWPPLSKPLSSHHPVPCSAQPPSPSSLERQR